MKRDLTSYRTRLQDRAQAEAYATRFERGSRKRIDQREQRAVRKIFSDLPECRSVIDVPCGAGRFLKSLHSTGRVIIGADSAFEILEHAQQRASVLGTPAGFVQGDASQLPCRDASVDAVFCNRLLHHILDVQERAVILREFYRVSTRYVVSSFFDYRAFGGIRRWLKRLKGRKPPYEGQPTLEQFAAEAIAAGFRVRAIVPTGPFWVTQKYFVLEK